MPTTLSCGNRRRYVLDANALIGFFEDREVAARRIERLGGEALRQSSPLLMSAVNWGEVFYTAWRRHVEATAREAEERLLELPIAVIEVDRERASRVGALMERHNLGYADAFA